MSRITWYHIWMYMGCDTRGYANLMYNFMNPDITKSGVIPIASAMGECQIDPELIG